MAMANSPTDAAALTPASASSPAMHETDEKKKEECYVCGNTVGPDNGFALSPCSHIWCDECIFNAFSSAIKSEANLPVICCNVSVPVGICPAVEAIIGRYLKTCYLARMLEHETSDRTYCHVPWCSTFIPPSMISGNKLAVCGKCQAATCAVCKKDFHGDRGRLCKGKEDDDDDSRDDDGRKAFKTWWGEAKLKKCPRCGQVVERSAGCNQIRCICGQKFCYTCGKPWTLGSCNCPLGLPRGPPEWPDDPEDLCGTSAEESAPAPAPAPTAELGLRRSRRLSNRRHRSRAPSPSPSSPTLPPMPQLPTFRRLLRPGQETPRW